ncbi:MAG TPA: endonuclease III domain-containing protein [Planctomycetota bacterium]|nr:endonuclease III domain-containing protein [Planctomycetota bacterium]
MPTLEDYYRKLSLHFGPQRWWPGETPFEVMVGAVLAQNTAWRNAERAIQNLKTFRLLDPHKIHELDEETLQEAIRPAGFFRQKAKRIKAAVAWLVERFGGSMEAAARENAGTLRTELLEIKGIGPETADSILLYALGKPAFVIDTYTYRVLTRHHWVGEETTYEEMQELMQSKLPRDAKLYNEYHALMVAVGKEFCRTQARCDRCPLKPYLPG